MMMMIIIIIIIIIMTTYIYIYIYIYICIIDPDGEGAVLVAAVPHQALRVGEDGRPRVAPADVVDARLGPDQAGAPGHPEAAVQGPVGQPALREAQHLRQLRLELCVFLVVSCALLVCLFSVFL